MVLYGTDLQIDLMIRSQLPNSMILDFSRPFRKILAIATGLLVVTKSSDKILTQLNLKHASVKISLSTFQTSVQMMVKIAYVLVM
jgi:hypothetical protein